MQVKKQQLEPDMEQQTVQIERGVQQSHILSLYLFNSLTEYDMWNATLDESQAGNQYCREKYQQPQVCRYNSSGRKWTGTEDPLDEGWEETKQASLKLNNQKTKTMASRLITSWQMEGGKSRSSVGFYFISLQNHCRQGLSHQIKRCLLLRRKAMTNLDNILKSRDITLPIKVHTAKAMVFAAVKYRHENWTIKKAEHQRTDALKSWCWKDTWEYLR